MKRQSEPQASNTVLKHFSEPVKSSCQESCADRPIKQPSSKNPHLTSKSGMSSYATYASDPNFFYVAQRAAFSTGNTILMDQNRHHIHQVNNRIRKHSKNVRTTLLFDPLSYHL